MKRTFLLLALAADALFAVPMQAQVKLTDGTDLCVEINKEEAPVVHAALEMFKGDYEAVFGRKVTTAVADGTEEPQVVVQTIDGLAEIDRSVWANRLAITQADLDTLLAHREAFLLQVSGKVLHVVGSDKRGTAYGLLELSRLIGVSPWEWWADSRPAHREKLVLAKDFRRMAWPSVKHRGIFLNDEDFALTPWAGKTHEPTEVKGTIGPRTHERIFQLLLRLRANTFWPAMHECSVAFYLTPGNREMADKYGIYVGTSHCEPMVRNTNAEWKHAGKGTYDYVNNRERVLAFWEERVRELAGSDNIYTLGIRGVHDSKMLGANTVQEQKEALTRVLKDQREMIARHVNPDVTQVSQVFIPYKEVLDVYNLGLEVPEDVSLMWCDDNYGYIRHFPTPTERARRGGNGVYYHVSYWGRPHDYLWLASTHPALLYTQMKRAYDKGARDQWILNVGDIKPTEYLTELFMDMGWDMTAIADNRKGLDAHLHGWLSREFGSELADALTGVMTEYYRLAYIRKPEFMGNTRTEEKSAESKRVKDLPWTDSEVRLRIGEYARLDSAVTALSARIPEAKRDAWFQLIEYPVRAAAAMNHKHLYAQLARHGEDAWTASDAAYDTIVSLTARYNSLAGGKWNRMMNHRPRNLAVFDKVERVNEVKEHTTPSATTLCQLSPVSYSGFLGTRPVCHGLGYHRTAISIDKGSSVLYDLPASTDSQLTVEVALAPNHPVEGNRLRFALQAIDGEGNSLATHVADYHTEGRSEEWKVNVLTNRATRLLTVPASTRRLVLTALDEGVVLDEIKVTF